MTGKELLDVTEKGRTHSGRFTVEQYSCVVWFDEDVFRALCFAAGNLQVDKVLNNLIRECLKLKAPAC